MIEFIFSAWTVVVFVIFCGIVVWAWSGRRKAEFEQTVNDALELEQESEQ